LENNRGYRIETAALGFYVFDAVQRDAEPNASRLFGLAPAKFLAPNASIDEKSACRNNQMTIDKS